MPRSMAFSCFSILISGLCCVCVAQSLSSNINLSFGIRTVCSCEGENLTLLVLHSGNENLTVSSNPPRNVKITVKREEEVTIKWKSVVQGTCCFSIEVGPPPPLSSQDICYVGEVYNDTWICSMNGSVVLHIESSIGKEVPDDCSGDLQRIANLPLPCASSDAITLSSMEQLPQATIIVLPSTLVTTTPSSLVRIQSTAHSETTTRQTTQILPSVLPTNSPEHCKQDGRWDTTRVGTNATMIGGCYSGTVDATRRCTIHGRWNKPHCLVSSEFSETLDEIRQSPDQGLSSLWRMISRATLNDSLDQYMFLLDDALRTRLTNDPMNDDGARNFTRDFMSVSNTLIDAVNSGPGSTLNSDISRSIGAQMLLTMDDMALNVPLVSDEVININDSIFMKVIESRNDSTEDVIGIEIDKNSITIPAEVFKGRETVRLGSFVYHNLSRLLPPEDNNSTIVSSVISSVIYCDSCPLTMELNENVTIRLLVKDVSSLQPDGDRLTCVFFDFERSNTTLPTGQWSTQGCTTSFRDDIVTCSCNHLTHFAILLSPGLSETNPVHDDILGIIGLVLVPVSLCCMVIVILTYTMIRSLWSMRNYIHVMLCVSLCMAQLVFIIGIDKIEDEKVCSAIAVLLQYLFLVSFMWMLMEGVVLYVTLVRVFVESHAHYVIGFTVASYLIPAVYMLLVVPIGYLVNVEEIPGHTHYLYYTEDQLVACWLNYDTGFIWSFIAPVILIILVNGVFFTIAMVVMSKHFKKQINKDKAPTVRHWLKTAISLTLVLGITWLVGLLVFRQELLFVAYVVTIFIAGQGVLLFVILVPCSRQVREVYVKLWHKKRTESSLLSKIITSLTPVSILGDSSVSNSDGTGGNSLLEPNQSQHIRVTSQHANASPPSTEQLQVKENEYEIVTSSSVVESSLHDHSEPVAHNEPNESHCEVIGDDNKTTRQLPAEYEVPMAP